MIARIVHTLFGHEYPDLIVMTQGGTDDIRCSCGKVLYEHRYFYTSHTELESSSEEWVQIAGMGHSWAPPRG